MSMLKITRTQAHHSWSSPSEKWSVIHFEYELEEPAHVKVISKLSASIDPGLFTPLGSSELLHWSQWRSVQHYSGEPRSQGTTFSQNGSWDS